MAAQDIAIVVLAVSAFSLFGGVLGWASWMESRDTARKRKSPQERPSKREQVNYRHELINERH